MSEDLSAIMNDVARSFDEDRHEASIGHANDLLSAITQSEPNPELAGWAIFYKFKNYFATGQHADGIDLVNNILKGRIPVHFQISLKNLKWMYSVTGEMAMHQGDARTCRKMGLVYIRACHSGEEIDFEGLINVCQNTFHYLKKIDGVALNTVFAVELFRVARSGVTGAYKIVVEELLDNYRETQDPGVRMQLEIVAADLRRIDEEEFKEDSKTWHGQIEKELETLPQDSDGDIDVGQMTAVGEAAYELVADHRYPEAMYYCNAIIQRQVLSQAVHPGMTGMAILGALYVQCLLGLHDDARRTYAPKNIETSATHLGFKFLAHAPLPEAEAALYKEITRLLDSQESIDISDLKNLAFPQDWAFASDPEQVQAALKAAG